MGRGRCSRCTRSGCSGWTRSLSPPTATGRLRSRTDVAVVVDGTSRLTTRFQRTSGTGSTKHHVLRAQRELVGQRQRHRRRASRWNSDRPPCRFVAAPAEIWRGFAWLRFTPPTSLQRIVEGSGGRCASGWPPAGSLRPSPSPCARHGHAPSPGRRSSSGMRVGPMPTSVQGHQIERNRHAVASERHRRSDRRWSSDRPRG